MGQLSLAACKALRTNAVPSALAALYFLPIASPILGAVIRSTTAIFNISNSSAPIFARGRSSIRLASIALSAANGLCVAPTLFDGVPAVGED
jgi:hypothetical protein